MLVGKFFWLLELAFKRPSEHFGDDDTFGLSRVPQLSHSQFGFPESSVSFTGEQARPSTGTVQTKSHVQMIGQYFDWIRSLFRRTECVTTSPTTPRSSGTTQLLWLSCSDPRKSRLFATWSSGGSNELPAWKRVRSTSGPSTGASLTPWSESSRVKLRQVMVALLKIVFQRFGYFNRPQRIPCLEATCCPNVRKSANSTTQFLTWTFTTLLSREEIAASATKRSR